MKYIVTVQWPTPKGKAREVELEVEADSAAEAKRIVAHGAAFLEMTSDWKGHIVTKLSTMKARRAE